jgi:Major capsid protein 13-like
VVETLQQFADGFNAASANTLLLVTRSIKGDYEKESFIKSTAALITRRDPTLAGAVTDNKLSQNELVGIKINRRIGPVAESLDAFKKIAVDPAEFSMILGQQTGAAVAVDYINSALNAVRASISANGALAQSDNTVVQAEGVKTLSHTALVNGISLFGDRASRIQCFVMHSKNYFDLLRQAIAQKVFEVAGATIYSGTVASLGKPVLVTDSISLQSGSTASNVTLYDVLGLPEDAVEVAESEERTIISQPVTGQENLVMRIQGEYAFNLRCKGMAYNLIGGGTNPTDLTVGNPTNWTLAAADVKLTAGVRVTCN